MLHLLVTIQWHIKETGIYTSLTIHTARLMFGYCTSPAFNTKTIDLAPKFHLVTLSPQLRVLQTGDGKVKVNKTQYADNVRGYKTQTLTKWPSVLSCLGWCQLLHATCNYNRWEMYRACLNKFPPAQTTLNTGQDT